MVVLQERVLRDVISEVLETMFFTDVDFEECDTGSLPFEYGSETLLVNPRGCIVLNLRMGEKFARMITANFLGLDELKADTVGEEELVDSLKEFSNMVAGGCHAHVNDADWKLGIPRAWRIGADTTDSTSGLCGICFEFLGEPAGTAFLRYLPGSGGSAQGPESN